MKPLSPLILSLPALALLGGCGSAPTAPVPDGHHRLPINTPEHINQYGKAAASLPPGDMGRDADRQRLDALEAQVASLRGIAAADAGREHAPAPTPPPPVCSAITACPAEHERVEVRTRAIVFHIPFDYAAADFHPSLPVRQLLLKVAADSPRIEIRGRTDAASPTSADALLAKTRALQAHRFLVRQGVAAAKLHVSALASGGQVADNATADGRAQNRRVEIEVMDLDPQAYATSPAALGGAQHEPD